MSDSQPARRGGGAGVAAMITLFVLVGLVAAGVWAAYTYGDGNIVMDGRTIDELQPWEVVLGVVIAIIGAMIGILGGVIGLVIGLAAALISLLLAGLGIAAGLFITAGVLMGPVLLLVMIIMLMRRGNAATASPAEATDLIE